MHAQPLRDACIRQDPQARRCLFKAHHLLFQGFFLLGEWEGTQVLVDGCQAETPRRLQYLRQLVA